ncbi:MAG: tetratricopeptide repeat protein [bacterium]
MKKLTLHPLACVILGCLILAGCGRDPVAYAIKAIDQGNLQQAELLLTRVIQEDPADLDALANLCIVQLKNGQQDVALAGFIQLAGQVKEDPRPLEYAAGILIEGNRLPEAAECLAEAARRAPRSPSVQTAQALIDLNTTGAAAARERLLKVVADYSTYAPALFNLGVIHRDWLKTPGEARKYFQRYLAVEKNDPHVVIARVALAEKPRTSPAPKEKKGLR